jgi:hypothetical protein
VPDIDLLSPSSFAHGQPHDQFAWLREHAPVHWHPEPGGDGFWVITRTTEWLPSTFISGPKHLPITYRAV